MLIAIVSHFTIEILVVLTIVIHLDFYDVLPQVLKDINDADYVAIDGEFTGILGFDKMNYFDTPAERYKRHYEVNNLLKNF